jgi:hypothetical protein
MAGIHCPGCKANISVPGLIDCPLCQTFLDPPFLRELNANASRENRTMLAAQALSGTHQWFNWAVLGTLGLAIAALIYVVTMPSEKQERDRRVASALASCQKRIAGLAEFGEAETPPYTKNWAGGDEFYFAWQRGSFHFKNGFGALVPMSASCTGVISTGEIHHLTLNNKDVI